MMKCYIQHLLSDHMCDTNNCNNTLIHKENNEHLAPNGSQKIILELRSNLYVILWQKDMIGCSRKRGQAQTYIMLW